MPRNAFCLYLDYSFIICVNMIKIVTSTNAFNGFGPKLSYSTTLHIKLVSVNIFGDRTKDSEFSHKQSVTTFGCDLRET